MVVESAKGVVGLHVCTVSKLYTSTVMKSMIADVFPVVVKLLGTQV